MQLGLEVDYAFGPLMKILIEPDRTSRSFDDQLSYCETEACSALAICGAARTRIEAVEDFGKLARFYAGSLVLNCDLHRCHARPLNANGDCGVQGREFERVVQDIHQRNAHEPTVSVDFKCREFKMLSDNSNAALLTQHLQQRNHFRNEWTSPDGMPSALANNSSESTV